MSEPKWIPIEQQEPPKNDWYLVYFPKNIKFGHPDYGHMFVCYWNLDRFEGGALDYQEGRFDYTHWMPLPEPPKGA